MNNNHRHLFATEAAVKAEEEDQIRLRRAREYLEASREAEAQVRRDLAAAIEQTKRAKEKAESLFIECENRAVARRKAGEIVPNPGY